jgi:hypothetical protein
MGFEYGCRGQLDAYWVIQMNAHICSEESKQNSAAASKFKAPVTVIGHIVQPYVTIPAVVALALLYL